MQSVPAMHRSLAVFAVCCLALATVDSTCTRPSSKPTIPTNFKPILDYPTFRANVEFYDIENAIMSAIKFYYDQISQSIRMTYLTEGLSHDVYYYYTDNEILTFNYDAAILGTCIVDNDLNSSPTNFIVGGPYVDPLTNKPSIPPPLQMLHFTGKDADGKDIYPSYVGNTTIRDKDVYEFNSCQSWIVQGVPGPNNKITAKVTHYFSTSSWSNPGGIMVPVEVRVVGQLGQRAINHSYSYFNVMPQIPVGILQTPDKIACPGRKVDKPFPALPRFMQMSVEAIDATSGGYDIIDEIYDLDDKISVLRIPGGTNGFSQFDRYTIINNYRSGLSYKVDSETKQCDIQNITSRSTWPFKEFIRPEVNGREYSPQQFFMAKDADYTYLGVKKIRGLYCDSWVANTINSQFGNVTVEWYFALNGTKTVNGGQYRIPVKCRFWFYQGEGDEIITDPIIFNIFHVDYSNILFNSFSIKSCLTSSDKNRFQLIFQNATKFFSDGDVDMQDFRWSAVKYIANVTGAHWLRITDLRVIFKGADLIMAFNILDQPPFAGDGIPGYHEDSLQSATDKLNTLVMAGNFTIYISKVDDLDYGWPITASQKAALRPAWNHGPHINKG